MPPREASTKGRPTAAQGIEALKIHQLRRENVVIFDEIRGLRGEVASRQLELDKVKSEDTVLKTQIDAVHSRQKTFEDRFGQLEKILQQVNEDIKVLQQEHTSSKATLSDRIEEQENAIESNKCVNDKLTREVLQLRDELADAQKTNMIEADELRDDVAAKVNSSIVADLEQRLDDLRDKMNARLAMSAGPTDMVYNRQAPRCPSCASGHAPVECDDHQNLWKSTGPVDSLRQSDNLDVDNMSSTDTANQVGVDAQPLPPSPALPSKRKASISNIVHEVRRSDSQPHGSAPSLEVLSQKTIETPQVLSKLNCQAVTSALQALLGLRQSPQENLEQCFNRLTTIMSDLPVNNELVAVCLRRFQHGLLDTTEAAFVQRWADTSSWSLQNVRDCILLLTACLMTQDEGQIVEPTVGPIQQLTKSSRVAHKSDYHDVAVQTDPNSGEDRFGISNMNVYKKTSSPIRVRPTRKAKSGASQVKLRAVDAVDNNKQGVDNKHINSKTTGKLANELRQLSWVWSPTNIARLRSEETVTKAAKAVNALPTNYQAERSIFDSPVSSEDEGLCSSPPPVAPDKARPALNPIDAEQATSRVPTLLASERPRVTVVPETSDAIGLPPVLTPDQVQRHAQAHVNEVPGKRRKLRYETPPAIPILSMSSSTFGED